METLRPYSCNHPCRALLLAWECLAPQWPALFAPVCQLWRVLDINLDTNAGGRGLGAWLCCLSGDCLGGYGSRIHASRSHILAPSKWPFRRLRLCSLYGSQALQDFHGLITDAKQKEGSNVRAKQKEGSNVRVGDKVCVSSLVPGNRSPSMDHLVAI